MRGLALALVIATIALILAACSPFVSKGTMPPPGPNGEVDPSSAPDFIAVAGPGSGIAGYARKEDVLDPGDGPFPVYGEDLRTIVGQMVPGKGFVPAGVDPRTVPEIPVVVGPSGLNPPDPTRVILYVRNDASREIDIAVLVGGNLGDGVGFLAHNFGVGCFTMPTGSQLVLLDRAQSDPGVSIERVLYTRGSDTNGSSLWIAVKGVGALSRGVGVPRWWVGQSC